MKLIIRISQMASGGFLASWFISVHQCLRTSYKPTTASKQRLCRGNSMGNTSAGESRDPVIPYDGKPYPVTVKMKVGRNSFFGVGDSKQKHKVGLYQDWGTNKKTSSERIPISLNFLILKTHYNLHQVHRSYLFPCWRWHSQYISFAYGLESWTSPCSLCSRWI